MNTLSRPHSADTSERHDELSRTTTLHGHTSLRAPDPAAQGAPAPVVADEKIAANREKADIIVVDWDGPEDPSNPKKYVQ